MRPTPFTGEKIARVEFYANASCARRRNGRILTLFLKGRVWVNREVWQSQWNIRPHPALSPKEREKLSSGTGNRLIRSHTPHLCFQEQCQDAPLRFGLFQWVDTELPCRRP